MRSTTDVAIVGGGIIGCAIAYYLSKAGIDVTLLEQGEIGAEASSAAAGLLAPLGSLSGPGPFADLLLASWSMFPALVPELEEASGLQLEYQQIGALRVVRNTKNMPNLRKRMQAWQPLGLQMHWLTGDEARHYEPLLAPDVSAAIYAPQEAQIKAPHIVKAFARAAINQGATLSSHCAVSRIQRNHTRVLSVSTTSGATLACNHLIIATGAWAAQCDPWLNISLPVYPQRGQILSLRQPVPALQHLIFGEAIYLSPRRDGTIIVGATKDEVGFDKHLTASGINWLLTTAIRLVPHLAGCAIEQMWAGLRPRTPDNQPILGPAPDWNNVTLALGHGSVGVVLSPVTGKTIAELMLTATTPEIIKPFSLQRF